MNAPEVRLLGNGLLLSECIGEELVLKHISLETGALVKESSIPSSPGTKLIIGSGEIGLCDRESGLISVLDESFRLLRTYEVPQEGDDWYLNSELDTLYVFYFDRGLLARNLQTGEAIWLVDNGFHVAAKGSASSYILFEYTDRADQKTYSRCLNLSMATLETLPIGGMVSSGIRHGETWLLRSGESQTMIQGEDALYSEEAWLALQPEGFRYAESYTDIPAELLPFMESRYFITEYALTYPGEDRAVLMEATMSNYTWDFEPGSGARRKLQYYADCIRDCFDTEGWPEATPWELVLE